MDLCGETGLTHNYSGFWRTVINNVQTVTFLVFNGAFIPMMLMSISAAKGTHVLTQRQNAIYMLALVIVAGKEMQRSPLLTGCIDRCGSRGLPSGPDTREHLAVVRCSVALRSNFVRLVHLADYHNYDGTSLDSNQTHQPIGNEHIAGLFTTRCYI